MAGADVRSRPIADSRRSCETPAMVRFKCEGCNEWHEGIPSLDADAPLYYYYVPAEERSARCKLTADTCVVDGESFFIRGQIELPVHGQAEPFQWGVWTSLSEQNFKEFVRLLDCDKRSQFGPYFGWLSANLKVYPDAENLKTHVHLRDHGVRPYVELEPTDHLLAVEQREGISVERLTQILSAYSH